MFLLGALGALGLPISQTATILCFAAALVTAALLPLFSSSLGLRLYGLEALMLALNTSYGVWAGSAMEMVPFSLLLILAVFGSGLPVSDPGGPIARVFYTDAPQPDIAALAHGNLEGLLMARTGLGEEARV